MPAGCRPWRRQSDSLPGQVAAIIRKQVQLGIELRRRRRILERPEFPLLRAAIRTASRRARCGRANAARGAGRNPRTRHVPKALCRHGSRRHDVLRPRRRTAVFSADQNGRDRPDQGPGDGRDPARDRCLQGGAEGRRRRRGGLHLRVRAGLARSSHLRRALRQRRGIRLRSGRRAARGISRGGRCRLHPADRRSRRCDVMGHDQAGSRPLRSTGAI